MRKIFYDFVTSGDYYVGICAGVGFIANKLNYNGKSFDYDGGDAYSLYPHNPTIPEWPGKNWAKNLIVLPKRFTVVNTVTVNYFTQFVRN